MENSSVESCQFRFEVEGMGVALEKVGLKKDLSAAALAFAEQKMQLHAVTAFQCLNVDLSIAPLTDLVAICTTVSKAVLTICELLANQEVAQGLPKAKEWISQHVSHGCDKAFL